MKLFLAAFVLLMAAMWLGTWLGHVADRQVKHQTSHIERQLEEVAR